MVIYSTTDDAIVSAYRTTENKFKSKFLSQKCGELPNSEIKKTLNNNTDNN